MQEIEPTLLELAEQAREASRTINKASGNIRFSSAQIGRAKDLDELNMVITEIRGANRPFVDKIEEAEEEYNRIAIFVASLIDRKGVLHEIQAERNRYRETLDNIEGGITEGTLKGEIVNFQPNVLDTKKRAAELTLIIELYRNGSKLYPEGLSAVAEPSMLEPAGVILEEVEDLLKVEQKELLGIISVLDEKGTHIKVNDVVINWGQLSAEAFNLLFKDLNGSWRENFGVHSTALQKLAKAHGYVRDTGSHVVNRLNDTFSRHKLQIRVKRTPDPANRRFSYYRLRKVLRETIDEGNLGWAIKVQDQKDGQVGEKNGGEDRPLPSPTSRRVYS